MAAHTPRPIIEILEEIQRVLDETIDSKDPISTDWGSAGVYTTLDGMEVTEPYLTAPAIAHPPAAAKHRRLAHASSERAAPSERSGGAVFLEIDTAPRKHVTC
jgi:hypothetical protein